MKSNCKFVVNIFSLAIAGVFASSLASAATKPAVIAKFTVDSPDHVLKTKSSSWRDPAFGDMGWTHSSDWGKFWAKKGETVTITAISVDPGLHPGISVWSRGADDTAPNSYVVDHFYPQNANTVEYGAKDESTGASIGNIVMKIVEYGYDQDGNSKTPRLMNGIKDTVPGQLVLTFQAPRSGFYMFVLGGFNPDVGVDAAAKHDINTNVTVQP